MFKFFVNNKPTRSFNLDFVHLRRKFKKLQKRITSQFHNSYLKFIIVNKFQLYINFKDFILLLDKIFYLISNLYSYQYWIFFHTQLKFIVGILWQQTKILLKTFKNSNSVFQSYFIEFFKNKKKMWKLFRYEYLLTGRRFILI